MLITCVHQGYELYGSDRCFIETVAALREEFPGAKIDAVLPRHGPIVSALEPHVTRIVVEPIWVLRRKNFLRLATYGLLRLPHALLRAAARMRRSDIVYINTAVVADYILANRLCRGRAIIHVHEIPQGLALFVLRNLLRFSRAEIVFNSNATRATFPRLPAARSRVIYNGLAGPERGEPQTYDGSRPLRLLMLGRYSRIKGQEILIRALALLPAARQFEAVIAGSGFEDESRQADLASLIDRAGLSDTIALRPFVPDPEPLYRWADIVVVPSRLPESLGRVAIEAMSFGRPPLVSAVGGLTEVVENDRTGWLVPPGSPEALAAALQRIADDPAAWSDFPAAARRRYEERFSETVIKAAIKNLVHEVLAQTPAPARKVEGMSEHVA